MMSFRNHPPPAPVAMPITPRDDAYHDLKGLADTEWWYFDVVLENGDSVTVGIRTFHMRRSGMAQARCTYYKQNKVLAEGIKTSWLSEFQASSEEPRVVMNGETLIRFDSDHYQKTGEWRYHVTLAVKRQKVDLVFTGITPGWKMETMRNSWVVPLPKAHVEGTVTVDGTEQRVRGIGYHDHNWDYPFFTTWLRSSGWYWGRVIGEQATAIWAKTTDSLQRSQLILVVNQLGPEGRYFTVPPEHIMISAERFEPRGGQRIPTQFVLSASDPGNPDFSMDIRMTADQIQHNRIFTAHYWRYHAKSKGMISLRGRRESFDDHTQILERLMFRRMQ